MRRVGILALTCIGCALAQGGRGAVDWTTAGNDAQRSFWVRSDPKISVATMQKPGFQFLWKVKLNSEPRQLNSLTVPVLLDRYIGYRGFRSLGFVGGSSDQIFALDTDLGRIEWQTHLPGAGSTASASVACPGGLTANLTRPTPVSFAGDAAGGRGFGGRGGPARSAVGEAGQGAVTLATALRGDTGRGRGFPGGPDAGRRGGGGGFGRMPAYIHALSSDGMFHTMYVSNGIEPEPPVRFLTANANVHGLILIDNMVYATTSGNCGGVPDAVWALDVASKEVNSWKPSSGEIAGGSGAAFGPDGTLYVTTTSGDLAALEPKTLKLKGSYSPGKIGFTSSPLVFDYNGKALIAAAAADGLHLVDSASLKRVAAQTAPVAGDLASWHDASGARWLLAPGATDVRAWKIIGKDDALTLQPGWTSREMAAPLTPVIVNGVVFAVSSGEVRGGGTATQRAQRSSRAILYALDGATGKELWNSGNTIATFVHSGGLSVGAGQMYLGSYDGTLYAFGFPIEH